MTVVPNIPGTAPEALPPVDTRGNEGETISTISAGSAEAAFQCLSQSNQKFCRNVARMIVGDDATEIERTAIDVAAVIAGSNKQGIFFHGVSKAELVAKVLANGVAPLTHDTGDAPRSCWTSGKRLFSAGAGEEQETVVMSGYDTSFFHYGLCTSERGKITMTIVATRPEYVWQQTGQSIPFEPNSELSLTMNVPPQAFHTVRVVVTYGPEIEAAKAVQFTTQQGLRLLREVVQQGCPPGESTKHTVTMDSEGASPPETSSSNDAVLAQIQAI